MNIFSDMTGASIPDTHKLLQADKGSQSNATRLVLVILVLVIIAVFGKSLLKPNAPSIPVAKRQVLPAMNSSEALDSLEIPKELLASNGDSLVVNATDFLSIIQLEGESLSDTIYQNPGQSFIIVLSDTTQLMIYPADAVLLSIKEDTLLGSPFSNSWLQITADSLGGYSRTYPTL